MSAAPVSTHEPESLAVRQRRLVAARRRATALLGAVTVLFIAVTAVGVHGTLLGYVQAGAEAAMVGGVADWFAVTALFRRPLGLPIPHTALIVERKDQFAATLGQFVQENFLNAEVLAERIRAARLVPRLAVWLADPANAARFAGYAADLVVDGGRGAARRGCPARAHRRTHPGHRRRRGGPAGRAGPAGHHRGRPARRAVQRRRVRRRPLSRRPSRGASRAVRGRGAPLGTRHGLPAGLRPPVLSPARAAGSHGRRSRRRGPPSVRGLDRRSSRPPRDRPGAARARRAPQARRAGQRRAAGLVLLAVAEGQGNAAGPGCRPRVRAAPPAGRGAGGGRPPPRRRPSPPRRPGAHGRIRRRGPGQPVPRRARRPGHRHHRAVGRRPDLQPAGTASRPRPAVHPHQRYGRRGRRRRGPARHRPGPGLIVLPPSRYPSPLPGPRSISKD